MRSDYAKVVAAVAYASGDTGRAEDAVQEALVTALEHRDPIEDLPAWVARVALNRVRSKGRRLRAERRAYERAAFDAPTSTEREPISTDVALLGALRKLPPRQREIVVLHYLLDMSVSGVAATTGVTTGTVKTQLHRARTALRAHLSELPGRDEEVGHVG